MKTYMGVAIVMVMVATASARPQESGALHGEQAAERRSQRHGSMARIVANYQRCLESDVPGVVETALGHLTYMRIAFPKMDLGSIHTKLEELAVRGSTREIRYKAFTALEVFGEPATFQRFIETRDGNGDGILEEIAPRILPRTNLVVR
ncbi:MAG: hypothetical protein NTU47_16565 [Ignavibacteriales bacterium]|nr:hypothetical protein [Ignavibacteriales bacterium]